MTDPVEASLDAIAGRPLPADDGYAGYYGDEPTRAAADKPGELLDELREQITRYVAMPSPEAADAVTLFVACTHAQDAWQHASRLVIKSPLKRCGKTRLQEVIAHTAHRPLRTTNISVAALVRSIDEKDPPVLILDEADAVFRPRRGERSESAEDLRGILNSGYGRGTPYIRWDPKARAREECPTFAMAVLGCIGDAPDTVEDRAVIIPMRRRAPDEKVERWRERRSVPTLHDLRERLHDWVLSVSASLAEVEPPMPERMINDRQLDTWEPLAALADAAGGDWPARARTACIALCAAADDATSDDDTDASERLLSDLRAIFGDAHCLYTVTLLDRLADLDEAPWAKWHRDGSKLSPRGLAKLLKPYGVRTKDVREDGTGAQRKGLYRSQLEDVWRRYLTAPSTATARAGDSRDSATEPALPLQIPTTERVAATATTTATAAATPRTRRIAGPEASAALPVAPVAPVADKRRNDAVCDVCGTRLDPWLVEHGERTHPYCTDNHTDRRRD